MEIELSVIVPTLNECSNIEPLITVVENTLKGVNWELIVVDDDSSDGTPELLKEIAQKNPKIRYLHRIGRRGLSSACIEGMLSSSAPFLAVMDADLQHDESLLPKMLETLKRSDIDIVVGSRYVEGGGTGNWKQSRVKISKFATYLSSLIMHVQLSDPMSGFFMLRRSFFEKTVRKLSGRGFKILLDLFTAARGKVRFLELPYTMKTRKRGDSKLDTLVVWEFCLLLFERLFGNFIPVRFLLFVCVGCAGAVVHILFLAFILKIIGMSFAISQTVATLMAMAVNFTLNNLFTYRDQRLHGLSLVQGLVIFYLACGIGAIINIRIADYIYQLSAPWWLSGLIGAMIGAVWNYSISSTFAWKPRSSKSSA